MTSTAHLLLHDAESRRRSALAASQVHRPLPRRRRRVLVLGAPRP